ncbi:MAG: helix-turn-helix transcriptional regulator [Ferruginibacter sp.]
MATDSFINLVSFSNARQWKPNAQSYASFQRLVASVLRLWGGSREMIGRYERGEVMPSIEVAKKISDALEVSLDYLAGDGKKTAVDKQTMKLIHDIEDLEPTIKDKLIFLANAIIRDSKTKKAYA